MRPLSATGAPTRKCAARESNPWTLRLKGGSSTTELAAHGLPPRSRTGNRHLRRVPLGPSSWREKRPPGGTRTRSRPVRSGPLDPSSCRGRWYAARDSNPALRIKSPEHNHPCSRRMAEGTGVEPAGVTPAPAFEAGCGPVPHCLPWSGWPDSNRRPRAPEARALPSCATTRWSGRQDLNLRPPGPQPGALPNCATSRCVPRTGFEPATPWFVARCSFH